MVLTEEAKTLQPGAGTHQGCGMHLAPDICSLTLSPPPTAILVLPPQWFGVSLFSCQDARPPPPRKQLKDVVGDKLSTEMTLNWSLHTGAPLLLPVKKTLSHLARPGAQGQF